jgi:hypothetical protein
VFIHLNGVEDTTSFVEVERTWSSNPPRGGGCCAGAVRRAAAQAAHSTHAPDCGTSAKIAFTAAVSGITAMGIRAALLFTPVVSAFVPVAAVLG